MFVPIVRSTLLVAALSLSPAIALRAQATAPRADSTRGRAGRDTLETVVVRATRAGGAAPTSRTTLDRAAIERTYAGQDAPLALLGTTAVTVSSDAGAFSGYSAIRLRGIDQTRLAISVDGVPLNDPEDQVLYFSNVPDFMNSMQSVTVQRGAGASAFGTAPFAGSLSFESLPLATTAPFGEAQLTTGSWGTRRASLEGATGLQGGFAAYARVSGQETEGYRRHSGNRANSAFVSGGWFGARDALKFTGFAGRSRTQLAYYAPGEAELAVDRRANPMSELERDDFHQEMASLQWARALGARATLTTTVYRNGAGGAYDVVVAPDLWNFNLDHRWVGLLSAFTWSRPGLDFATGAHVSGYSRDHYLKVRPDLETRTYDNTGFKREQSAFAKATLTRGAVDWHADLQLRRAEFRYRPTTGTGIGEPTIDWVFLNPRLGLTWRARPAVTLHASLGRVGREPSRSDLFAGADDVDAATAVDVLPLTQVRPERLTDLELGARIDRAAFALGVNLFAMRFHDEIAPIGRIAITGSPLRRNVDRSSRAGVELEGAWRPGAAFTFTANTMWMRARIAEYTDQSSAITFRDVAPLLSPALLANVQGAWHASGGGELTLSARHVGRSFLANDGNAATTTPPFTLVDAGTSVPIGRVVLRLQLQNLLDAKAYASGYTDGSTRYLFPVATRTALATLVLTF
ncbi:MAG: TonB-dependent receptor [Gemmatimonadetes bacterium]|nr:TonB-dependent receptor [Gemmatimonadota bacterium]